MNQGTPTLQQVIKDAIESRVTDIHVSMPGIVQTYNPVLQTAEIQPVIKKKYADGTIVNLPLLINVPVIFPRTSKAYLHFPLAKDDYVLLIFCERSIDVFLQKGGVVDPEDYRKHALSDAVAIAGLYPMGSEIVGETEIDKIALVNGLARVSLSEAGITSIGKKNSIQAENIVLGMVLKTYLETLHAKIASLMNMLIAGDIFLTTAPASPTAPNPPRAVQLTALLAEFEALKASPIMDKTFLSDIFFTEKGI